MVETLASTFNGLLCYFDNYNTSGTAWLTVIARNGNASSANNLGTANGGTLTLQTQMNTSTKYLQVNLTTGTATVNWSVILL